jgi:hypothetical protein
MSRPIGDSIRPSVLPPPPKAPTNCPPFVQTLIWFVLVSATNTCVALTATSPACESWFALLPLEPIVRSNEPDMLNCRTFPRPESDAHTDPFDGSTATPRG